jgi:hypothetical protein
MAIARNPYSMALLGLIYAKKTPLKISRLGTFNERKAKKKNSTISKLNNLTEFKAELRGKQIEHSLS